MGVKMEYDNPIQRFRYNTYINLLFNDFKSIPLIMFIKNGNKSPCNINFNLNFLLSFTLVVFGFGVFTHIVQAESSNEEIQSIMITKFRSTPEKSFSKDSVKDMLKRHNFFCKEYGWSKGYSNPNGSGFNNNFEVQKDGEVIYDHASGLMWQKSGSYKHMDYDKIKEYIDQLNLTRFAGYDNWRLPTLEEAMSLMEPTENNDRLYIASVFDKNQVWIWTSDDLNNTSSGWVVDFSSGGYYYYYDVDFSSSYVRAVR